VSSVDPPGHSSFSHTVKTNEIIPFPTNHSPVTLLEASIESYLPDREEMKTSIHRSDPEEDSLRKLGSSPSLSVSEKEIKEIIPSPANEKDGNKYPTPVLEASIESSISDREEMETSIHCSDSEEDPSHKLGSSPTLCVSEKETNEIIPCPAKDKYRNKAPTPVLEASIESSNLDREEMETSIHHSDLGPALVQGSQIMKPGGKKRSGVRKMLSSFFGRKKDTARKFEGTNSNGKKNRFHLPPKKTKAKDRGGSKSVSLLMFNSTLSTSYSQLTDESISGSSVNNDKSKAIVPSSVTIPELRKKLLEATKTRDTPIQLDSSELPLMKLIQTSEPPSQLGPLEAPRMKLIHSSTDVASTKENLEGSAASPVCNWLGLENAHGGEKEDCNRPSGEEGVETATQIQPVARAVNAQNHDRKILEMKVYAATCLQSVARGMFVRNSLEMKLYAAIFLQSMARGMVVRNSLEMEQYAATCLQSVARGMAVRKVLNRVYFRIALEERKLRITEDRRLAELDFIERQLVTDMEDYDALSEEFQEEEKQFKLLLFREQITYARLKGPLDAARKNNRMLSQNFSQRCHVVSDVEDDLAPRLNLCNQLERDVQEAKDAMQETQEEIESVNQRLLKMKRGKKMIRKCIDDVVQLMKLRSHDTDVVTRVTRRYEILKKLKRI